MSCGDAFPSPSRAPFPDRYDTPAVLKRLAASSRQLAELKGLAATRPSLNPPRTPRPRRCFAIGRRCAAVRAVGEIRAVLMDYKHRIRTTHRFYSQDLINNLFTHPYKKIEFVQRDLDVSRLTATRYLDALAESGFVSKVKRGRSNYFVNVALQRILVGADGS